MLNELMIMNQNFLNFEIIEVTAPTKKEAQEKIPFSIMKDASVSYNKWLSEQEGEVTELQKKTWMIDYTAKNSKNKPGVGFIITLDSPVVDTRMCPYTIEDVKNTQGKRTFSRVIQLVDSESQKILGLIEGTKAEALKVGRDLYKKGYKGAIDAYVTHHVTEGERLAFKMNYSPSKGTHDGKWIAFGVKA